MEGVCAIHPARSRPRLSLRKIRDHEDIRDVIGVAGTRSLASEKKPASRPSAEIAGPVLPPFPSAPCADTLRRVVLTALGSSKIPSASVSRSRRKTSRWPLVSVRAYSPRTGLPPKGRNRFSSLQSQKRLSMQDFSVSRRLSQLVRADS
jgi:hypothetical protein